MDILNPKLKHDIILAAIKDLDIPEILLGVQRPITQKEHEMGFEHFIKEEMYISLVRNTKFKELIPVIEKGNSVLDLTMYAMEVDVFHTLLHAAFDAGKQFGDEVCDAVIKSQQTTSSLV